MTESPGPGPGAAGTGPALAGLTIADPQEPWEELGFTVLDRRISLGGVYLELIGGGRGIIGWSLLGLRAAADIDGLATTPASDGVPAPAVSEEGTAHANGALGLDHIVVITPDFDRTGSALQAAGLALRRIRDAGGFRQGFRRLGPAILEVVEAPGMEPGPARFWGLVVIVADLDALAPRLGERLGEPKNAVQAGRRIATLRRRAGLSPHVAFMTPEARPT